MIKYCFICTVQLLLLCCISLTDAATWFQPRSLQVERNISELPILDDIINSDPDLSTLAIAFLAADLNGVISTSFNFTFFAPTKTAFAAINQTLLDTLVTPSWIMHLTDLLLFHVTFPTVDRVLTQDFTDGLILDMINGEQITVRKSKKAIHLSSPQTIKSDIIDANIKAANGALHKIDSVLLPGFFGVNLFTLGDTFVDFTTLQQLFELGQYQEREGSYTLLAPDNSAFLSMTDETLESLKNNTNELILSFPIILYRVCFLRIH
jgi:uncharacterized surface protein with fasciclin (FAS1) repeats